MAAAEKRAGAWVSSGRDLPACLAAALAGEGDAGAEFVRHISGIVWTSCTLLAGEGPEARAAFEGVVAALCEGGFARLRGYKGRGRVETYVAVVTRDLLANRVLRLLFDDRRRGWAAFERFFGEDLRRQVRRRLNGAAYEDMRADAYQELCAALVEDDYRRLRQYTGQGSFTGFVLRTADRLLIDFVRSIAPRRRLPAAVARLGPLEQDVFRLLAWRRIPAEADSVAAALASAANPKPPLNDIVEAIAAVRPHVQEARDGNAARGAAISLSALEGDAADALIGGGEASPEDALIGRAGDDALALAAAALRRAGAALSDGERIYLEVVLGGGDSLPAREIARLMKRPVEEVYKLKQRVHKCLRAAISDDPAVKNWRASV